MNLGRHGSVSGFDDAHQNLDQRERLGFVLERICSDLCIGWVFSNRVATFGAFRVAVDYFSSV